MQGNDPFSDDVKKNLSQNDRSVEISLITLERAQKLDLLIHLISNLSQTLVICGAHGIGKTSLLDELRLRSRDVWPIATINATAKFSFESFLNKLSKAIKQNYKDYGSEEIASTLAELDKKNQKIVIVIDDAGLLVPGLVTSLIEYAESCASVRLVFALTHDELHIKSSSDHIIDDCHFIEIPPLTEKQCGVFLQNMSVQPKSVVSFNAINDRLIEKLYRETHGIPGKIIAELPRLSNYSSPSGGVWGSVLIATIVLTAIVFILIDNGYFILDEKTPNQSVLFEKPELIEILPPVIYSEIKDTRAGKGKIKEDRANELLFKEKNVKNVATNFSDQSLSVIAIKDREGEEDLNKETKNNAFKLSNNANAAEKKKAVNVSEQNNNAVKMEKKPLLTELINVLPVTEKNKGLVVESNFKKPDEKKAQAVSQKRIVIPSSEPIVVIEDKGNKWLLGQPSKNYTIQIMVLSKKISALAFLKNNKELMSQLKLIHVDSSGQKKYVLLYGSFKNAELARRNMKALPVKYRKSWLRRLRDLQKEITQ